MTAVLRWCTDSLPALILPHFGDVYLLGWLSSASKITTTILLHCWGWHACTRRKLASASHYFSVCTPDTHVITGRPEGYVIFSITSLKSPWHIRSLLTPICLSTLNSLVLMNCPGFVFVSFVHISGGVKSFLFILHFDFLITYFTRVNELQFLVRTCVIVKDVYIQNM